MPACPSLMCSFNRGNIEGTNSSKICVWCLYMYVLCLRSDCFCRLTCRLIYKWEEFRNVYLLMTRVWLSWGDVCLQSDWFCRLTCRLVYMWEEFRYVYLLMTWVWLSWGDPVVDRTLKSNYYHSPLFQKILRYFSLRDRLFCMTLVFLKLQGDDDWLHDDMCSMLWNGTGIKLCDFMCFNFLCYLSVFLFCFCFKPHI